MEPPARIARLLRIVRAGHHDRLAVLGDIAVFGAAVVTIMLVSYALEARSPAWILVFAVGCAASALYAALAGTWPFMVVEGVWSVVALRRWSTQRGSGGLVGRSGDLSGPPTKR
jgi:hypothetical protein